MWTRRFGYVLYQTCQITISNKTETWCTFFYAYNLLKCFIGKSKLLLKRSKMSKEVVMGQPNQPYWVTCVYLHINLLFLTRYLTPQSCYYYLGPAVSEKQNYYVDKHNNRSKTESDDLCVHSACWLLLLAISGFLWFGFKLFVIPLYLTLKDLKS